MKTTKRRDNNIAYLVFCSFRTVRIYIITGITLVRTIGPYLRYYQARYQPKALLSAAIHISDKLFRTLVHRHQSFLVLAAAAFVIHPVNLPRIRVGTQPLLLKLICTSNAVHSTRLVHSYREIWYACRITNSIYESDGVFAQNISRHE